MLRTLVTGGYECYSAHVALLIDRECEGIVRSMKLVVATLLAFGAPFAVATASAGQEDAATGGGQVLIGSRGGAGDTIAFTAKGTMDSGTGQVQYVDRAEDGQTVFHGTVSCLAVAGNVAKISGIWTDGGTFGLYVEDNGEGAAADDDVVTVLPGETTCDFDEPDDDAKTALARGNAQVRDN